MEVIPVPVFGIVATGLRTDFRMRGIPHASARKILI